MPENNNNNISEESLETVTGGLLFEPGISTSDSTENLECPMELDTDARVEAFVAVCAKYDFRITLTSGGITVNAKDLAAVRSLDNLRYVTMNAYGINDSAFMSEIRKFMTHAGVGAEKT